MTVHKTAQAVTVAPDATAVTVAGASRKQTQEYTQVVSGGGGDGSDGQQQSQYTSTVVRSIVVVPAATTSVFTDSQGDPLSSSPKEQQQGQLNGAAVVTSGHAWTMALASVLGGAIYLAL